MSAWIPDRRFAGQVVAVIAGGPSATPSAVASVAHLPRIAVRNAYRLAPDADVVLSLDADVDWFVAAWAEGVRERGVPGKEPLRLSGNPDVERDDATYGVRYIGLRYERVRVDANTEVEIRNSGLAAVRIFAEMGASEILLVGFDPGTPGYASGYEPGVQQPGARPYGWMAAALAALTNELAAKGVTVRRVEIAPEVAEIRATANDPAPDVPEQPAPAEAAGALDNDDYDLDSEAARRVLQASPIRAAFDGDFEILHDGRWLKLCREDLCQEVCSTIAADSPEDARRAYLGDDPDEVWGARLRPGKFVVIDSGTDG